MTFKIPVMVCAASLLLTGCESHDVESRDVNGGFISSNSAMFGVGSEKKLSAPKDGGEAEYKDKNTYIRVSKPVQQTQMQQQAPVIINNNVNPQVNVTTSTTSQASSESEAKTQVNKKAYSDNQNSKLAVDSPNAKVDSENKSK